MFDKCMTLSAAEYADNKVGSLMSLFTNDLETIDECFGWGILRFFDAVFLGGLAVYKMANMSLKLTLLAMVPMALMIALSALVGKFMAKNGNSGKRCMRRFPILRKKLFRGFP